MSADAHTREFERRLGRPMISARRFAERVAEALDEDRGFAAGKLGISEQAMLRYPMLLASEADRRRVRAFEQALRAKTLLTAGIFPPEPEFHRRWCPWYAEQVRGLDSVGLFPERLPTYVDMLAFHEIGGEVISFYDQEPDRSVPTDERRCWLPALRDRRVLLVSPFAGFLRERADAETFEAVWAKIGKRWFGPASVDALEFPYGYSPATRERYATSLDLFDEITGRMAEREFDVAIIGAGGMGIPIAVFAKRLGRVGISLGGPIQPLFGVRGQRWNERDEWHRDYFNDSWVDLPARYRPGAVTLENYW